MEREQLWAEGEYDAVPKSAYADETKSGNGQIVVTFDVGGHEKKVFLSLSDAAWPYSAPKLERIGFNGNFTDPGIDTNMPIKLNCKHDFYNNKWKEKWDFFGSEREAKPLPRDKAAALAARFKATVGQASKPAGRPTPPPPAGSSRPGVATSNAAPRPGTTPRPTTQTPPAEKPKQVAKTGDEAWAYWSKTVAENVREKLWTETLVKFGKPEDQFTPDDWNKMANAADIPF
jgi:hypothetical protein